MANDEKRCIVTDPNNNLQANCTSVREAIGWIDTYIINREATYEET